MPAFNAQSAILEICREFSESRPNRKVVPSTPRLSFWTVLFRHNRRTGSQKMVKIPMFVKSRAHPRLHCRLRLNLLSFFLSNIQFSTCNKLLRKVNIEHCTVNIEESTLKRKYWRVMLNSKYWTLIASLNSVPWCCVLSIIKISCLVMLSGPWVNSPSRDSNKQHVH